MPAADADTLRLPARVDAVAVAALWREWVSRAAPHVVDFSAVQVLDSSGVALLRLLQQRAEAAGTALQLLAPPPRYAQLCLAHRVQPGRH